MLAFNLVTLVEQALCIRKTVIVEGVTSTVPLGDVVPCVSG